MRRDAQSISSLREQATRRGGFLRIVPEFRTDVHDLSSLERVAGAVFAEDASDASGTAGAGGANGADGADGAGGPAGEGEQRGAAV